MVPFYHIAQVSHLFVHGIRGKFQTLTNINDDDLAHFFEKYFEYVPAESTSQRTVALQEGEVIGTISFNGN